MIYTDDMRKRISKEAEGKVIDSLTWADCDGGYWVMSFNDGSEMCFNCFMAEVALPTKAMTWVDENKRTIYVGSVRVKGKESHVENCYFESDGFNGADLFIINAEGISFSHLKNCAVIPLSKYERMFGEVNKTPEEVK